MSILFSLSGSGLGDPYAIFARRAGIGETATRVTGKIVSQLHASPSHIGSFLVNRARLQLDACSIWSSLTIRRLIWTVIRMVAAPQSIHAGRRSMVAP